MFGNRHEKAPFREQLREGVRQDSARPIGTDPGKAFGMEIDEDTQEPTLVVRWITRFLQKLIVTDIEAPEGEDLNLVTTGGGKININGPSAFTGMIAPFATDTPPDGWLAANGAAVSRTTYAELFAVIGTTWGSGDGSTTFNLPDGRGAVVRGAGTGTINGRSKVGPDVGSYQEDQMQRITGSLRFLTSQDGDSATSPQGAINVSTTGTRRRIDQRSQNGPWRVLNINTANSPNSRTSSGTDGETRVYGIGGLICIKY